MCKCSLAVYVSLAVWFFFFDNDQIQERDSQECFHEKERLEGAAWVVLLVENVGLVFAVGTGVSLIRRVLGEPGRVGMVVTVPGIGAIDRSRNENVAGLGINKDAAFALEAYVRVIAYPSVVGSHVDFSVRDTAVGFYNILPEGGSVISSKV